MRISRRLSLLASVALGCVALVVGCASNPNGPELPLPPGAPRILFIGNSLTYANNLPGLVAEIARADGHPVGVASVATPNTALIDHVTQGDAQARIAEGGWTAVVLQQGPTTPGLCRDTLVLATQALDARIRAVGARTATLMTWPYDGYPDAYSWVHESAQRASDAVHGLFLPGGDAWVAARRLDPSIQLYSGDGYHPSAVGSLLTAFVVYQGVTGRDVREVPTDLRLGVSLPTELIRLLQQVASEAFTNTTVVPRANVTAPAPAAAKLRETC